MKKIVLAFILILLSGFTACSPLPGKAGVSLFAMDTYMQLDIYGSQADSDAAEAELQRLDKLLSSTNPESDISRINQSGSAKVDADTYELLRRSVELCKITDGSLDITVYPIVKKWGFISREYSVPSQAELAALLKNVGYNQVKLKDGTVTVPKGFELDLGAVAKGYAADMLKKLLVEREVHSAVLNLGGTVLAHGEKPDGSKWKVGVTDPENTERYMGVLECRDTIVVTSGDYERFFIGDDGKTYCHIIDPKSGYPAANGIASVTVISPDGTQNDALTTALFVMGLDRAGEFIKSRGGFDCIILTKDKKAYITKGIEDSFIIKNEEYEKLIIDG